MHTNKKFLIIKAEKNSSNLVVMIDWVRGNRKVRMIVDVGRERYINLLSRFLIG